MKKLILIAALVAGCSFAQKIQTVQKSELSGGTGLIVLSTWAQETSASGASDLTIKRKVDGKEVARLPIDNPYVESHFPGGHGFLGAFKLPPGDYVVDLFSLHPYTTYESPKTPIGFSLRGGESAYLGEAHFFSSGGYSHIQMRDKFDRDVSMFIKSNPTFAVADFERKIPGAHSE